jgi:hypothetical protein
MPMLETSAGCYRFSECCKISLASSSHMCVCISVGKLASPQAQGSRPMLGMTAADIDRTLCWFRW